MLKNDQTYNEMTALNIFTDVEYFDVEKKIAIYPRFEASVLLIKHVLGQRSKKISNDMKDQMAQRSSSGSNEMHPDFSFLLDKTEKKFQVVKEIVENLPSLAEKREFEDLLATQEFLKGFINWSKSDYTTARKTFYQTYPPKIYRTELEKLWFDQEYTLWQSEIKEKYGIHPSKYKKLLSENIKKCVEFIWPNDRVLTTQEQIWKLVALIFINLQETENEAAEKLARMVVRLSDEMHVIEFACMAMDCGEVDFKALPISNTYPEHLLEKFKSKKRKNQNNKTEVESEDKNNPNPLPPPTDQTNNASSHQAAESESKNSTKTNENDEMLEKVKRFFEMSEIKSTGEEVLGTLDDIKRQNAEEVRLASLAYLDELLKGL